MADKVYAVIPAYNEEKTVKKVVERVQDYVTKVIVVDDGSVDKTSEGARQAGSLVLRQKLNMGVGFTLETGCEAAIIDGADLIVTLDADGQHNPAEIPELVKALQKNKCDIVFGSRPPDDRMPWVKKLGNWFIYQGSKFFFRINVKDTQSGFRVFRTSAWDKLKWESSGYEYSVEIVTKVGENDLRYMEVPIETIYSDAYKGTTVIDGLHIFLNMFWWWLR